VENIQEMDYAIYLPLLIFTIAIFFVWGHGHYRCFGILQILLRILVSFPLLISAILLHFLRTDESASIIPPLFPAHHFLTLFTGVLEIAGAVALFVPYLRRPAAFWIAVMMVSVFPANIYGAGKIVSGFQMPGVSVRAGMQIIYILLVLLAGYGIPGQRDTQSR
jgi:uncharacterized membrane protein